MPKSRFTFMTFEEFLKQEKKKETHKFITFEEFLKQQEQTQSICEFIKKNTLKTKVNH